MDSNSGPTGVMSAEEQARAKVAIGFLIRFEPEAWKFFLQCLNKPKPRSSIHKAKRNHDLVNALDVSLRLDSASDHYQTVVRAFVTGPLQRYSIYTVVRAALESDAWACWLLDPTISESARLERALSQRASNLLEIRRLGLGHSEKTPDEHYDVRIGRVLAAAQRWNLVTKTHNSGQVTFPNAPTPGITALLRELLPQQASKAKSLTVGEYTYAALSVFAHGSPLGALGSVTSVARLDQHRVLGTVEVNVLDVIRLLGPAVSLHDEGIKRIATLSGADPSAWEQRRGALPWNADGSDY